MKRNFNTDIKYIKAYRSYLAASHSTSVAVSIVLYQDIIRKRELSSRLNVNTPPASSSGSESGYSSDSNRLAVSESRDDYALNHMPTEDVPEDVLPRFVSTMELVAREAQGDPDVGQLHADRYQALKTERDSRIEACIMPRPNVGQVNIYSESGGAETSIGDNAAETSRGGSAVNKRESSSKTIDQDASTSFFFPFFFSNRYIIIT